MSTLSYAALWLFVFSVPWDRLIVLTGMSVITRATGALALGLTMVVVVFQGRLRRWRAFHGIALLFLAWSGIGILILHLTDVPAKFYSFVQLFLVMWMIWEAAPSRRRVTGLLLGYVFGSYVAALATILLYHREAGELRRFAAGGMDPNDLAMTLALALPMAWYLGNSHPRPIVRWICRMYLPVGLLAIALTGSRGGMIAAMVALLIVPLTMTNLSPGKLVSSIAMLGLAGALAVVYVPQTVVQRLATTSESVEDLSLGGRFKLWKAGMHAFTQRPVMGYGTAAFKQAIYPEMGGLTQIAHNSYISVLVEEGIVGLLLYLLIFGIVVGLMFRLPRLERRFALVLLATLAIAILPLSWEDQKPVWLIWGLLIGMVYAPATQRFEPATRTLPRGAQRRARSFAPPVAQITSPRSGLGGDAPR